MSPLLIPILALLIPVVAILATTYQKVEKMKAETATRLGHATDHLEDELAEAQAERDRLRRRIEVLEAIVTTEGFDLEREARQAGITAAAARLDPTRLDPDLLDLDVPERQATRAPRRRTR